MDRDAVIEMILDPSRRPLPGSREHQAFLAYLESSPECRTMYEQQEAVWEALEMWAPVEPSAGFDHSIYGRIPQRPMQSVRWWGGLLAEWIGPWRPGLAAGLAALLLIAGMIVSYQPRAEVQSSATALSAGTESEYLEQIDQTLDDIEMLADFEGLELAPQGPGRS